MKQLEIDWENVVHGMENNLHSEGILWERQSDFSAQCKKVYDLLKSGKRLTVRDAMLYHGIGDLRRRVKDLRDNANVNVQSRMIGKGFKEYYL